MNTEYYAAIDCLADAVKAHAVQYPAGTLKIIYSDLKEIINNHRFYLYIPRVTENALWEAVTETTPVLDYLLAVTHSFLLRFDTFRGQSGVQAGLSRVSMLAETMVRSYAYLIDVQSERYAEDIAERVVSKDTVSDELRISFRKNGWFLVLSLLCGNLGLLEVS